MCFVTCLTPYPANAAPIDNANPTPGIIENTPSPKSTIPLTTFPCENYLTARTPLIAKPTKGIAFKSCVPTRFPPSLTACLTPYLARI